MVPRRPLRYLRLSAFDTSSELGRTEERYRLLAWGAVANVFSSALAFLALVVTIPLTLSYLSEERFGVWMTVASLAGMLTFLDMGVGNGFISHVARIRALGDSEELRGAVTRGLVLLTAIGLVVGLVLTTINTAFPLQELVTLESAKAREEARICSWAFVIIFALGIPLSGIYRIFNGMQKSWAVHVAKSIGSILSILAVVLLAKSEAEPQYLLAGTYGVQTAMPLSLLPYIWRKGWLTTTPHRDWQKSRLEYKYLLNAGGLFLILQIGTMAGWGADALLVSSLAGAAAVAQLAIAQRMYQLVSIPLSIINAPLWAAYADAKAHGDLEFIKRTFRRSLLGTLLLSGSLSTLIFLASESLLTLWIGDAVEVSTSLLLAFLFWKILEATGNSLAMFLNGFHIMKPQVISVVLFCALALPLKFHFVPQYGASAAIWCTVLAYTVATLAFYPLFCRHEFTNALSPVEKTAD